MWHNLNLTSRVAPDANTQTPVKARPLLPVRHTSHCSIIDAGPRRQLASAQDLTTTAMALDAQLSLLGEREESGELRTVRIVARHTVHLAFRAGIDHARPHGMG